MANVDWLKELRDIGVRRAVFSEQNPNGEAKLLEVEFFPTPTGFAQVDLDAMLTNPEGETERPPADEDAAPNSMPPAMQRILNRGSVS